MKRLRTAVLHHRRALAAGCVGLAVFLSLTALRQPADTVSVLTAADDLPSGHEVTVDDVEEVHLPQDALPARAAESEDDVVGRRVGGPMRAGEVFTDARVIDGGPLAGRDAGSVLSTIRIADAAAVQGLRVGDRVDVVAVASADHRGGPRTEVVAEGLEVAALPTGADDGQVAVSLVASRGDALTLARSGLEAPMSIVVVAGDGTG